MHIISYPTIAQSQFSMVVKYNTVSLRHKHSPETLFIHINQCIHIVLAFTSNARKLIIHLQHFYQQKFHFFFRKFCLILLKFFLFDFSKTNSDLLFIVDQSTILFTVTVHSYCSYLLFIFTVHIYCSRPKLQYNLFIAIHFQQCIAIQYTFLCNTPWILFMGPSGRFTHVVIILDCLGQVSCRCCIWVELPVQRRLCPIF